LTDLHWGLVLDLNPVATTHTRLQHELPRSSKVGIVYTDRIDGANSNRVLRRTRGCCLDRSTTFSCRPAAAGSRGRPRGNRANLAGHLQSRAGSGFISRPGVITTNLTHRVTWFGAERAALQSWRVSALSERNRLRIDALFPYQPTPGTVFFAGYSSFLTEPPGLQFGNLRRTNDGFFLKASYLFRL